MRDLALSFAAAVALTLAACTVAVNEQNGDGPDASAAADQTEQAAAAGWTVAVVAGEGTAKTLLVVAPDGRQAAAQSLDGVSRLIEAGEVRALVSEALSGPAPTGGDQVEIKGPFFSVNVNEGGEGEGDRVSVNAAGTKVEVNAAEDDTSAVVRLNGQSEADARKFIDEAQDFSPETKQALKDAVGL